jgi:hypothetical protein
MTNEYVDLLLIAARDYHVLLTILFFVGLSLVVVSFVEIPVKGTTISVKPENKKIVFRIGLVITLITGLIMTILLIYPEEVNIYGTVKYDDGGPAPDVEVIIGSNSKWTDKTGKYKLTVSRDEKSDLMFKKFNWHENHTLEMPEIYWNLEISTAISTVKLDIKGEVMDEDRGGPVRAWANLSGPIPTEVSNFTNSQGEFYFKDITVSSSPPEPLRLSIQIPAEPKFEWEESLEIPIEKPYRIIRPITLPSKYYVDVKGKVLLKDDILDEDPKSLPRVTVNMGGQHVNTDGFGNYSLKKVPIKTEECTIGTNKKLYFDGIPIYPPLEEGREVPRIRDIVVYKDDQIS